LVVIFLAILVSLSTASIDCEFSWYQGDYTQPEGQFYRCKLKSIQIFLDDPVDLDDSGEVNDTVISDLDNVTMLELRHPLEFSELPESIFKVFDNLEYLFIYHTSLDAIDTEDFQEAQHLKYLRINSNDLSEIKESTFKNAPNLEYINLSYNKIHVVHRDSFKGLEKLREIHLHNNEISMIQPDVFSQLPNLVIINLKDNLCAKEKYSLQRFDLKIILHKIDDCLDNYVDIFGGNGGVRIVGFSGALIGFCLAILYMG
jgi:Leucine-rich repeat (LRR) protein